MKNKYVIFALMALMLAATVQAGYIQFGYSNTTMRNDTFPIEVGTDIGMTECMLFISATDTNASGSNPETGTPNLRGINFGNLTNNTVSDLTFNWNISTLALQDGGNYNVSVFCINMTYGYNHMGNVTISTANSSIKVDNTIPSVATSLTSGKKSTRTFTVSSTATDANTVTCDLFFDGTSPINPPSCSLATNGTSCACEFVNVPFYSYSYYIATNDGLNITNSNPERIIVEDINEGSTSGGKLIVAPAEVPSQAEQPLATVPADQPVAPSSGTIGGTITNVLQKVFAGIKGLFTKLLNR